MRALATDLLSQSLHPRKVAIKFNLMEAGSTRLEFSKRSSTINIDLASASLATQLAGKPLCF
jgi:hypothetical protein